MTASWKKNNKITVIAGTMPANAIHKPQKYKHKWVVRTNQSGINVIRTYVSSGYNKSFIGRFWGYMSFMVSSLWAGLFSLREKYDVMIVTSPPLFVAISGILVSKVRRIPLIFEVRDLWPESAIDTGVLTSKFLIRIAYAVEHFAYKSASKIVVLTPAFKEKLIQAKHIPERKIAVIPNGSDFDLVEDLSFDRNAFRKDNGWEESFVFVYVGAHGVANQLEQLIHAATHLNNQKIKLVCIGDGMQKEALKSLSKQLNVNAVTFIEPVGKPEIFKYIMAADVGITALKKVPTFNTIYSNKTFDYMSCKTPILMLVGGISKELVERAECGIYAEPENAVAIAQAMTKLSKMSANELKQMGQSGHDYAKKHFDRKSLTSQYLNAISNTVNV